MPTIVLNETDGYRRTAEPLRFGLALAEGELASADHWRVVDSSDGMAIPAAVRVEERWPDGTVRWLFVECVVSIGANESRRYEVRPVGRTRANESAIDAATRDSGRTSMRFDVGTEGDLLTSVEAYGSGEALKVGAYLVDRAGVRHTAKVLGIEEGVGNDLRRSVDLQLGLPSFGRGAATFG